MPIAKTKTAVPHKIFSAESPSSPGQPSYRLEAMFLVAGLILHALGLLGLFIGRTFF